MKKVALIGNMNNNFYALTRYLRDSGYDAQLFYRLGMDHFQPMADSYTGTDVDNYCHKINWLDEGFHNINKADIVHALSGFDFYIGQGEEAAAAYFSGFKIDVYYPYGSDIYKYAHLPHKYKLKSKLASLFIRNDDRPTYKQMKSGTMAKYLQGTIKYAKHILADATNEDYLAHIKRLDYKGEFKNAALPFIYTPEYEKLNNGYVPEFRYKDEIEELRKKNDFLVLYHGRQEWITYHNQFTGKNTHYLIQGFAEFVSRNKEINTMLIMLEYGTDVDASKKLIDELGISRYVKWFPKMYRKELMYIIKNVDVCTGEFAYSFLTFGTIVEAMLMHKPVITHRDDDYYLKIYPELYPCLNAKFPNEIADRLQCAMNNKTKIEAMGKRAHEWVMKYFIQEPLQTLISIIESE